jgi:hypothetical protein
MHGDQNIDKLGAIFGCLSNCQFLKNVSDPCS